MDSLRIPTSLHLDPWRRGSIALHNAIHKKFLSSCDFKKSQFVPWHIDNLDATYERVAFVDLSHQGPPAAGNSIKKSSIACFLDNKNQL
jgi:hypothetical protein